MLIIRGDYGCKYLGTLCRCVGNIVVLGSSDLGRSKQALETRLLGNAISPTFDVRHENGVPELAGCHVSVKCCFRYYPFKGN